MFFRTAACVVSAAMALMSGGAARAVETVRIDAASGAPRFVIDGKPARARIFWGAPGVKRLAVETTGGAIAFEFSPDEDAPGNATVHFRFGDGAGDVYLDDIEVTDLGNGKPVFPTADFEAGPASFSRDWNRWPAAEKDHTGSVAVEAGIGRGGTSGMHVTLRETPKETKPDFHIFHHANFALIKGHRYRMSFWARAVPARKLTVAFYRPGKVYTRLAGPGDVFQEQIKLAGAAGVNLISFPVPLPWPRDGQEPDWSEVDKDCQRVLDANPQALLLPRIAMRAPTWWVEQHPDDKMAWDGPAERQDVAVTSQAYLRDAARHLRELVEHIERKFGPHAAGYHPAGQNTDEWFYQNTWGPSLNGYGREDLRAWRSFLREKYRDDAALRAAWNDPRITLDAAAVPTPAQRRAAPTGVLRDPASQRAVVDFAEFQQIAMADCVCALAKAARDGCNGRKLVVFFYGYLFEFGAVGLGPATSGHYALRRVLNCPEIDLLCSPISYTDRGLGQSAPAMTAAESVALAGKMWLYEDDTHTYLATGLPPGWRDHVDTLDLSNQELLRNTSQCALRNFGTWWMDLGASGWFNDAGMWDQMARLKTLDQPLLDAPTPYRPQTAAVIDEASMQLVAPGGTAVTSPGICHVRAALGRMGAPYGQYLMDDVLAGRVHAKLYVMLSAWRLTAAQRQQLRDATRGSTCVWCYAPGYEDDDRPSLDAMRELTGFAFGKVPAKTQAWAQPTDAGRAMGLIEPFGQRRTIEPLFCAANQDAKQILATYPDGSAAVAMKQDAGGTSIFAGPPGLTPQLLRLAARQAGVHLYTQADCNVYANGPFVVIHTSQDGPIELDVGRAGPVRDLLSGEIIGQGPKIRLDLPRGRTRILDCR